MMDARDLVFHGLAIKRHSTPEVIAEFVGLPSEAVAGLLAQATATGRAIEARGGYSLAPLARVALEARYGLYFADLRADPAFVAQYERFEVVNRILKQIITDWQTIPVRGERVANDHGDKAYDEAVIARLGDLHERAEPILAALAARAPRLGRYGRMLAEALEKAEDGEAAWVSDVRRESYHTVWFELHEDLLRILGRSRDE
jgi:hypothetical protein